jgi:1,2-dihydroxy-3-keto-5-methylthiopentene dioxygenase
VAILQLENGQKLTDIADIREQLATLSIQLQHWPIDQNSPAASLLNQPGLTEEEKESVLQSLDHYFDKLRTESGYHSRDLIVLHPETPNLDGLLAKFKPPHTHAEDEVRYIVDGEGIFGFIAPDGRQMELTIQPEEYINVPAYTPHWFYLSPQRRVKAVRYFSGTEGWVPEYIDATIKNAGDRGLETYHHKPCRLK